LTCINARIAKVWHIRSMTLAPYTDVATLATHTAPGTVLVRRGQPATHALHVLSGRITLGVVEQGLMRHQLGVVEGPCWLEAAASLLNLTHVVDAICETEAQLQWVAAPEFRASAQAVSEPAKSLLFDLARSQRQQTEVAVSRLAKDADARCAEWLLRHAEPIDNVGALAVTLHERKRLIAAQLGIAPETFSRVLRHLRELNLISGGGRVLSLLNPQALRDLAGA
jgi:CRP-like cAMP-binding protein